MGQFKPMVKMETTEPSVILHLKKGGSAKMPVRKMDGGAMGGSAMNAAGPVTPVVNPAAARAMAARRMARSPSPMTNPTSPGTPPSPPPPMGRPMMKKGGSMDKAQDKAMVKKAFKQHDAQEHKGGKGTKLKLATGGVAKSNSGGYATGGVVNGQAGYKNGGIIKGEGGAATATKMRTARPDSSPAKTGDVKLGNGGGFRKGGAAKKFAEGGRVQDDGGPERMKQGMKKPASPVSIDKLSGTYKKGGAVMMAVGGPTAKSSPLPGYVNPYKPMPSKTGSTSNMRTPSVTVRNSPRIPPPPKTPPPPIIKTPPPPKPVPVPVVPSKPVPSKPVPMGGSPRVESADYRRGGKVQNNGKKRGGAIC